MMIVDRARPALWKTVGWALLAIVTAAIAVMWSWNTLAADLFALQRMEFRHAFAVILLAGIVGAVLSLATRRGTDRHP